MAACRVFISFRLGEDDGTAIKLKEALEAVGISCFLCDPLVGDNLAGMIAAALDACELFVVLGTESYGEQGDTRFSTREELQFAVDHDKPIFLIKRCDEFADPLTRLYLPANMYYQEWQPHTPVHEGLVEDIKAKLEAAAVLDAQEMWVSRSL
jgi:hypothetical protein